MTIGEIAEAKFTKFKNWIFGIKEKKEDSSPVETLGSVEFSEDKPEEKTVEDFPQQTSGIICESCGLSIEECHGIKSIDGKKFHLVCYRKLRKLAKNYQAGNLKL